MPSETFNDYWKLLRKRPRRVVLRQVRNHEYGVPLTSAVEKITAGIEDSDKADPDAIRRHLHQIHLPELENANVVTYNETNGLLHPDESFDDIEPLIDLLDRNQDQLPDGIF